MSADLEYLIKWVADTSGVTISTEQAEKLRSKLKELQDSSEGAGEGQRNLSKGTKDAHQALTQLKESGRGGREVLEGLTRASLGGSQAIFGFAQSFRGLTTVFRATLGAGGAFGVALAAIGALAGGLLIFGKRSEEAKKRQEELASALDRSSKAAIELEGKNLQAFQDELSNSTSHAQSLQTVLENTLEVMGKVARAQADADIAKIQGNPSLSDAEKTRQVQDINARFTTGERSRQDTVLAGQLNTAFTISEQTQNAALVAEARAAQLKANLDILEQRKEALEKQISSLEKEQGDLVSRSSGFARAKTGASFTSEDQARLAAVNDQLERAQAAKDIADSEVAKKGLTVLSDKVKAEQASATTLRTAADQARENYFVTQQTVEAQRTANRQLIPLEDSKTAVENRRALTEATFGTGASTAARDVLSVIHSLPGDRSAEQEKAVAARTLEINRELLAKPGSEAGKTMANALVEALTEIFPVMTKGFKDSLRSQLADFDRKIQADLRDLKQENARNQAQTRDLRN